MAPGKWLWQKPIGWGASGIVVDENRIYTCFSEPIDKLSANEYVITLDLRTGESVWQKGWRVAFRGKQQIHDEPIQPLSTPLLHAGGLFVLSFDGIVRRLSRVDGSLQWQVDLVESYGATPVQYGFAASPIALGEAVVVAAGGSVTHMVTLRADNGKALWQTEADQPGYGTPKIASLAGVEQLVSIGRDAAVGYDTKTGTTLWRQPIPNPGQTNVTTPIQLSHDRILLSGQGIAGTRRYQIKKLTTRSSPKKFGTQVVHSFSTAIGSCKGNMFMALTLDFWLASIPMKARFAGRIVHTRMQTLFLLAIKRILQPTTTPDGRPYQSELSL